MAWGELNMPIQGPATTERQKLEFMAGTLGIDCANKTDDDLRSQISAKLGGQTADRDSGKKAK